ncbi:MAG: hypothetical protein V1797_11395 [Pseudomonadota bacterium]
MAGRGNAIMEDRALGEMVFPLWDTGAAQAGVGREVVVWHRQEASFFSALAAYILHTGCGWMAARPHSHQPELPGPGFFHFVAQGGLQ